MEICDQVVMDFSTAKEMGNFRPSERGLSLCIMLCLVFSLPGSIVLFLPLESKRGRRLKDRDLPT